jgi:hypothetical protein
MRRRPEPPPRSSASATVDLKERRVQQCVGGAAPRRARISSRSWRGARGSVRAWVVWSGGTPLPHLLSSGHRTFVAFYLDEPDPECDGTYVNVIDPTDEAPASLGLAEFKRCSAVKLGPPNEEVLHGHHHHGRGLNGYGAYVVEKSKLISSNVKCAICASGNRVSTAPSISHMTLVCSSPTLISG